MKVCLRFFHQEHGQIGALYLFQFDSDCGDVKKICIAVTGITQVFGFDSVISQLEAEFAGNIDEAFVRTEAK